MPKAHQRNGKLHDVFYHTVSFLFHGYLLKSFFEDTESAFQLFVGNDQRHQGSDHFYIIAAGYQNQPVLKVIRSPFFRAGV